MYFYRVNERLELLRILADRQELIEASQGISFFRGELCIGDFNELSEEEKKHFYRVERHEFGISWSFH